MRERGHRWPLTFKGPPRRFVPALFVLFVLLVLLIVNGTNFYLVRTLERELDSELDGYLKGVAMVVGRQVPWEAVSRFVRGDEGTREYRDLAAGLTQVRRSFDILDLTVLDPSNQTLFSFDQRIGSENPVMALDEEELAGAWSGQVRATPATRVGSDYIKRAYAPVRAPDGTVGAVVAVQTDVTFYRAIGLLSRAVLAVTVLSIVAIALLGLVFRRMLRYLLDADESLQRADKLASIGALAATVTHEVRNPLGIMSTAAELAARRVKALAIEDSRLDELHAQVMAEIERLNGIIERFLDVARAPERHRPVHREAIALEALVRPTADLAAPEIVKVGGRLEVSVADPRMTVEVDPGRIRQVLLNCLLNARDAIGQAPVREVRLRAGSGPRAGTFLLEVEDTGEGIPSEVRDRLFEPFVTTKPTGAGIGLTVVKNIVEEHRGAVEVRTRPGSGTCFGFVLPVSARG